jgi:hypothetical protein
MRMVTTLASTICVPAPSASTTTSARPGRRTQRLVFAHVDQARERRLLDSLQPPREQQAATYNKRWRTGRSLSKRTSSLTKSNFARTSRCSSVAVNPEMSFTACKYTSWREVERTTLHRTATAPRPAPARLGSHQPRTARPAQQTDYAQSPCASHRIGDVLLPGRPWNQKKWPVRNSTRINLVLAALFTVAPSTRYHLQTGTALCW